MVTRELKRRVIAVAAVALFCGCADDARDAQAGVDTLSRRQKDSLISEMPLPGAGAVGRALEVQDLTRQRAEALDTIS